MDAEILWVADNDLFEKDVCKLLRMADKEFVPCLSSRACGVDQNDSSAGHADSVLAQDLIVVLVDDILAGFMSFRELEDHSFYVSTIVIDKKFRGNGFTEKLYRFLFSFGKSVSTRTWSTNFSHLRILEKLGFVLTDCIVDDRGENIDTLHFRKDFRGV